MGGVVAVAALPQQHLLAPLRDHAERRLGDGVAGLGRRGGATKIQPLQLCGIHSSILAGCASSGGLSLKICRIVQESPRIVIPPHVNFETVYHFNGQQTVTLNGDKASGVSDCMVTLIGNENGKKMKTTIGIYYQDEYVRENDRWLIARRRSVFDWEDKRELGQ